MILTSRKYPKVLLAAVLSVFLLAATPAGARSERVPVTTQRARAVAAKLMSKVSGVSRSRPRSPSAQPTWADAAAGEPLLLHSFSGAPTSYLVPVVDTEGNTVSTVGVSATTGKWCWYAGYSAGKFPLVSAGEARAKAKSYLRRRGIKAYVPEPEARMAPDKLAYWFFDLGDVKAVKQVYVPIFFRGEPSSDLETLPWELSRTSGSITEAAKADATRATATSAGEAVGAATLLPGGVAKSHNIENVPYHRQKTSYWCGPASLEMDFDYWGQDVAQSEIAAAANATEEQGCYNGDLLRAAQFSLQSTAAGDPTLRGYSSRSIGYGAEEVKWEDGSPLYPRRYSDLKELISNDIPVVILTYYDTPPSEGHFRLVKGYDDEIGTFIVHDPWYTPPYAGPDVNFNQSFLVDTLWQYSRRWGMIATPWTVTVDKPSSVTAGQTFNVTASVSYRGPAPMDGQYQCVPQTAIATLQTSGDYELVGSPAEQRVTGIGASGSSGSASWSLRALGSSSTSDIRVAAQGMIEGYAPSYGDYSDIIGGVGAKAGTPPTTTRTWGHDSIGATATATSWFLAEGSTNGGFETWVLVQNPQESAAEVSLTYMTPGGPVEGPRYTLPANSRKSFSVAETVPDEWSVSTRVTSDKPVVAERAMYWGNYREGHDSIGVTAPAKQWYLAEGCTNGGFETWVLVQNPNAAPARVSLTYMTPSGPVTGQEATLEPNSRQTFYAGDSVPAQWSVSTMVASDQPVVAERAVYGGGSSWGTDSIGVPAPAEQWYLAEGCTNGGFESWVLVQNPNNSPANVTLTYMTAEGERPGPSETLPANSRQTFNVADSVPGNWEVSTKVTSDLPVVAERSMYGGNRTWGHDSIGVPQPAATWYLAEGCTHSGFETWVLVQNPNASSAKIRVTYMTSKGLVHGPSVTLPPSSRKTFNVAATVPDMWEVSTMVESTNGVPVIAERAMYGDRR
jgi:Peptidase_C39 like family/Family of unknown function (DUF5719)